MTLLSRILGFVRDVIIARVFGAEGATDAFFVAFKIPNFMRRLFAEGAFSQAFVPVFNEVKATQDSAALKETLSAVLGTLTGISSLVTTLGIAAAPLIIQVFAPGFDNDAERYALATEMLRITFAYLLLISLTAFAGGILNSYEQFAVPAFTPVFLNICLIGCAWLLSPMLAEPITALAWGVLLAGIVQLVFQIPFLIRLKLLPKPRWQWSHPRVQQVKRLMIPALFGTMIVQINLALDTIIASFLQTGSISWLYYADRLVEFPLGLFGIALATVILPHLSQQHAKADQAAYSNTLDWALKVGLLITLPAAAGLLLLAQPILITLFEYGEFDFRDSLMSAWSLWAYTLGLPAFVLIKILAPGFFAQQRPKEPVRIGIIAMVINMVMNILIVVPMLKLDFVAPHAGLALATSLSAWIHALMLYVKLKGMGFTLNTGWLRLSLQISMAVIVMSALLLWLTPVAIVWSDWSFITRSLYLGLFTLTGGAAYFVTIWLCGFRPRHLHLPG